LQGGPASSPERLQIKKMRGQVEVESSAALLHMVETPKRANDVIAKPSSITHDLKARQEQAHWSGNMWSFYIQYFILP